MKMKTIEEKAKAYDEVVNKLKRFITQGVDPLITRADVQDFFPELKVSEDEEVRKALYEYFKKLKDDGDIDETWYGFSYDKILAWLEKQGKQNLDNSAKTCKEEKTIVIIPKFRIGDEIKTVNEESLIITKIDEKGYWSEDLFICDFYEECLLDLVEQNHAWSEEDEEMCKEVLADIIYAKNDLKAKECLGLSKRAMKAFNWFSKRYKSLRPQNTWKPSEEQMKSLRWVIEYGNTTQTVTLKGIYQQLKKLREE